MAENENNDDSRVVPIEDEDGIFWPYDDPDNDDNLPEIDW